MLEGRSVFLRNVPFDAEEQSIEEMCASYGHGLPLRHYLYVINQSPFSKFIFKCHIQRLSFDLPTKYFSFSFTI